MIHAETPTSHTDHAGLQHVINMLEEHKQQLTSVQKLDPRRRSSGSKAVDPSELLSIGEHVQDFKNCARNLIKTSKKLSKMIQGEGV